MGIFNICSLEALYHTSFLATLVTVPSSAILRGLSLIGAYSMCQDLFQTFYIFSPFDLYSDTDVLRCSIIINPKGTVWERIKSTVQT